MAQDHNSVIATITEGTYLWEDRGIMVMLKSITQKTEQIQKLKAQGRKK